MTGTKRKKAICIARRPRKLTARYTNSRDDRTI
jgi:hypothetical protein